MSEVSATESSPPLPSSPASPPAPDLESLLQRLSLFWHAFRPPMPSWVAQELTFGQLRLLFRLSHSDGRATMSQVAEWLGVALPTASGTVERIERHGLVARQHRADDRRVVECALTPEGERLLTEIIGLRDEATRRVLGFLTPEELTEMDELFARVQARIETEKQQLPTQEKAKP